METVLSTKSLAKKFKKKVAVNNININIHRNEIYGLIGRNGAGKTTLMKMVVGFIQPTKGEIELFGDKDLNNQRKRIGCIIENPALYSNMSAVENLEIQRKLLGIKDKSCIKQVLSTVGLDTDNAKIKKFSLGMKQRLGIALALIGNPEFLILDEPLNGLDPEGVKDIRDLILKLHKEQGLTFIISSHILGELSKISTYYGIINSGILVEEFSAEELNSRCKRYIELKVDNSEKACDIIEAILHTSNYDVLFNNTIRIYDFLDNTGLVNSELLKSGVIVESLTILSQDLEGYFIERMGEENKC